MALMALAGSSTGARAELTPFIPAGTYAVCYGEPDAGRWLANPLALGGKDWDAVALRADYVDSACAWRLNDEGGGYISVRNTRGGVNGGDYIMKDSKIRLASTVNFVDYRDNQTFRFLGSEEECVVLSNAEANRHWSVSADGLTLAYAVTPAEEAVRFRLIPLYSHDLLVNAIAEADLALADETRVYDSSLRGLLEQARANAAALVASPGYGEDDAAAALAAIDDARERFVASGRIPGTNNLEALSKAERNAMEVLSLTGTVTDSDFLIMRSDMPNLRELHLEETSLEVLPSHALAGLSRLQTVVLPPSLRAVGNAAFLSCSSLQSLALPDAVETIGALAFARSGLRSVAFGAGVASLGASALDGCTALASIEVAEGNKALKVDGGMLLSADGTELIKCPPLRQCELTFPAGVKTVAPYALQGCTLLTGPLTLPEGLEAVGDYAFANCTGLSGKLSLPSSLKTVGAYAFFGNTGFSGSIELPESLVAVGQGAFSYLSGVSEVILPASLSSIAPSAFECCGDVTVIRSGSAVPPAVGEFALRGIDRLYTYIGVPVGSVDQWRQADVWSEFSNFDAPFEGYERFGKDGNYYIEVPGLGFLTYEPVGAGARAPFEELRENASLWSLEFFNVTSAALPYAGGVGSDIRFRSGDSWLHINMEGLCYSDPAATYERRDNRTFAFWLKPETAADVCPMVAIQGNGTMFGADDWAALLTAPAFSARYPRPDDFIFRLVPEGYVDEESAIASVEPAADSEAVYFDLNGRRVNPSAPLHGIFLRRVGSKTSKVIL